MVRKPAERLIHVKSDARRRRWLLCILVGFLPAGVLHSQAREGSPAQNALAGASVFGNSGCAQCHAVRGVGPDIGPDLGGARSPQSLHGFTAAMWNHLPQMGLQIEQMNIETPRLRPWEAGDLVAFLVWLDYFHTGGRPERGERLFAEKNCIRCHQVDGVGGVLGPSLDFLHQYGSPIQIAAAMWNHGPSMTALMRSRDIARPTFTGNELADLIAFLRAAGTDRSPDGFFVMAGDPDRGAELFESHRCIECHGPPGAGGNLALDLAARRGTNVLDFAAAMWTKAPAMQRLMRTSGISVPRLSPSDMADLIAYLQSFRYLRGVGSQERGRTLFRQKLCSNCHTLEDDGGQRIALSGSHFLKSRAGIVASLWSHIDIARIVGEGNWPTITESEAQDLTAYLLSLGTDR